MLPSLHVAVHVYEAVPPDAMEDAPLIAIDFRTRLGDDFRSVTLFLPVHVTPPEVYVAVRVAVWSVVIMFWFVTTPAVLTDAYVLGVIDHVGVTVVGSP